MKKFIYILIILLIMLFMLMFGCSSPANGGGGGGVGLSSVRSSYSSVVANETNTGATSITRDVHVTTFAELQSAVSAALSGDNILIDSNALTCNAQLVLSKENAYITIQAGTGYTPVLDFSAMGALTGDSGSGISIKGSYYTLNGITITKAPTKGLLVKAKMGTSNTASYNKFINCIFSYNGDSGVSISTGVSSGITNDGSKAAFNYFKNCDSYMNADLAGSTGPGGNADGFSCKLDPGTGNAFYGCRAWYNSDDGWDLYNCNYKVVIDNCWTWHNGDYTLWAGKYSGTWGGNGNGFKTGGNYCDGNIIVKNSVAFDHVYGKGGTVKGFDQNHQSGVVSLSNNLSFYNTLDYGWTDTTGTVIFSGSNYTISGTATFNCSVSGPAVSNASASDFNSILVADAMAARQADGSLPNNGFGVHK